MKAIHVHHLGGPEALEVEDLPDPTPAAGQAVVRLGAAGVNYIDIYFRTGLYKAPLPIPLGFEGAGTVIQVGEGVAGIAVGDRVAYTGVPGSYAEMCAVPAGSLVKLPEGLSFRDGAAAMLQGMTAHYLAHSTYPLQEGEKCLVHAAAGGVGLLLCQMAKMRGATVIGTVSTPQKADLARGAGADHTILYTEQDFVSETKRLTGGRGVDVVYDGVGATTFEGSLDCLRPRGMLALFGQSSGPVPLVDLSILNTKGSLFVTRPSLGHHMATRQELVARATDVLGWVRDGTLRLRVEHVFPLDQAADAHRALEGRVTTGKIVLLP
jgi:NADPH2:quinone reductase